MTIAIVPQADEFAVGDGSDGLPAPDHYFVCANDGHVTLAIPTEFVADGVCDCCDGSDEASLTQADRAKLPHALPEGCPNTCAAAASAAAALRLAVNERLVAGAKARALYAAEGSKAVAAAKAAYANATVEVPALRDALADVDARIEYAKTTGPVDEGQPSDESSDADDIEMFEGESASPTMSWSQWLAGTPLAPLANIFVAREPEPLDLLVAERETIAARLAEYEKREREAKPLATLDLGADAAFYALVGKCFSTKTREYEYTVCPFDKAEQGSASGSGIRTNLGKFETWVGRGYSLMAFRNGQSCYNGPQRSMTVSLECGAVEELSAVSEPEKCTYRAVLRTPAACSADLASYDGDLSASIPGVIYTHDEL
ncbi:glucosidase 2 subunit beta [Thecamonas trahens ATCC 50062]|uniref:Glucosidase 2 subunit beta n=1 Tax=Thecamonas trahens ATCC 50062 TaxID=461836 RepID=A0A0L0DWV0_THETB|nr:glucosidase 2 subunit beta [Thecamonas trahens ATCC 50062]KNC56018.1 glucosidase 2 subunit beta [Thecamonas trahens ATCC 50062]|eukprot:XP_013761062.1 glucosidase 2 subunit beta [Thecamonas trahens ATCC 50062]